MKSRYSLSYIPFLIITFFLMTSVSLSHAGGYIGGSAPQDYLNAQAVGPNVVAYLFAEYLAPPDFLSQSFCQKMRVSEET